MKASSRIILLYVLVCGNDTFYCREDGEVFRETRDFTVITLKVKLYIYATVQHNYVLKQYYKIKEGNMFRLTLSSHHQAYHNILTSV
jgi:hypothetical protein